MFWNNKRANKKGGIVKKVKKKMIGQYIKNIMPINIINIDGKYRDIGLLSLIHPSNKLLIILPAS